MPFAKQHTYGPTCHLAGNVARHKNHEDIPHLKAQFFYSSPLPIDDPLSAIPAPSGSESRAVNRPFSAHDNNTLEEAWLGLASEKDRKRHSRTKNTTLSGKRNLNRAILKETLVGNGTGERGDSKKGQISTKLGAKSTYEDSAQGEGGPKGSDVESGTDTTASNTRRGRKVKKQTLNGEGQDNNGSKSKTVAERSADSSVSTEEGSDPTTKISHPTNPSLDAGTTGLPFLKYSSPSRSPRPPSLDESESRDLHMSSESENDSQNNSDHGCKAYRNTKQQVEIPVGVSRLHLVKLPALQMSPIYWSPVHDIAAVTRATWFYQDNMYPVEPAVANQLEMGYRELRPWSQTWKDELNSALEVGALGEEKISHKLWPQLDNQKSSASSASQSIITADPYCAARCFHGEAAAESTIAQDDQKTPDPKSIARKYAQSHVIYKDSKIAFILKPTLQPSAYYGRRPLSKIKRGMTVGIPVIRGFDWRAWEKCHPSRKSKVATRAEEIAPVAGDANVSKRNECAACLSQEERPKVTDLVLVIHGIGQKLSERVESFHFTHAINTFRRSVNVELSNPAVQNVMRDDLGGIMVLPVNWRSNLSFEDGGPMKDGDQENSASDFSLVDITPKTIPAVRNLISDVMLDIPFYMSHHKPKMIQAVVHEANRIYRLWCKNNQDFHQEGRVHLIAHSLGSAMAVEVLSKQPTFLPKVDLQEEKINEKHFDFNTTNLFFCGSPAGFFLLLDKGNLIPRRGQGKPGAEPVDDTDPAITADAGTFGCLAAENIYNIMHYNDPIAYRLNATVDPQYAASLKDAQVPSATTGLFESIGNAVKSIAPAVSAPANLAVGQTVKPVGVARLPSQLEMAIHDFSREEVAEKRFCLLNDNCQVDWFLSSGGGPLEFQYLNMLGAHSSYWASHDFIRMIVTECGRKPGKGNALPNMKAIKVGHKA